MTDIMDMTEHYKKQVHSQEKVPDDIMADYNAKGPEAVAEVMASAEDRLIRGRVRW